MCYLKPNRTKVGGLNCKSLGREETREVGLAVRLVASRGTDRGPPVSFCSEVAGGGGEENMVLRPRGEEMRGGGCKVGGLMYNAQLS